MKKIFIILLALLLVGCIKDETTFTSHEIDVNFPINEELIFTNIYFKYRASELFGDVYDIRMTSELATYFLSASSIMQVKLNDKEIKKIAFSKRWMDELENDSIYHLNLQFYPTDEELQQIGDTVTSLSFSVGNKELYRYEHSPMYIQFDAEQFTIEESNHNNEYLLTNSSSEAIEIASLYLEDITGKQVIIDTAPSSISKGESKVLPITEAFLMDQAFIGEVGVYAKLTNGEILYLNKIPISYFDLNDPFIKKYYDKVNELKS